MLPPRISPAARQDIDELYIYGILTYGLRQADAYVAGLRGTINTIAEHPMLGREKDEIRPPVRLVPYEAHHLFYDVIDETVVLQRVLHRSANWTEAF